MSKETTSLSTSNWLVIQPLGLLPTFTIIILESDQVFKLILKIVLKRVASAAHKWDETRRTLLMSTGASTVIGISTMALRFRTSLPSILKSAWPAIDMTWLRIKYAVITIYRRARRWAGRRRRRVSVNLSWWVLIPTFSRDVIRTQLSRSPLSYRRCRPRRRKRREKWAWVMVWFTREQRLWRRQ